MNKLTDEDTIARGDEMIAFVKTKAWEYLKEELSHKVNFNNEISRIDEKNIEISYIEHKVKRDCYRNIINLVEKEWISQAERKKKNIKE